MVIVPTLPHMDKEGLEIFNKMILQSKAYLEYGSGGSTLTASASQNLDSIISVESDKAWADKIKSLVSQSQKKIVVDYVDIGPVGDWGKPLSTEKIYNYFLYTTKPWERSEQNGIEPDLVLIDGRFRVSTFLFSLLKAQLGTVILFDDYTDRPYYHVIEEFIKPSQNHGRMALFEVKKKNLPDKLIAKMMQYSIDFS